nr:hypothetical protein [Tanacetum cinerariifolium]
MSCSLPHTVEKSKSVQKQCEIDDAARQQSIITVSKRFNESYHAKQALKEQYAECKDILQERRVVIEIFLYEESMKDLEGEGFSYWCVIGSVMRWRANDMLLVLRPDGVEIHMLLYIKGKKNGRMMLESIKNGPLVYPTIEVNGNKGNAISSGGNNTAGQARVVKCYNCQSEGHMARQCTKPKKPRNFTWFKEKMLLVEAQESGQTDDLNAYDSDYCDDISLAKAVLMANLSSYDSDVLFEVPQHDTYQNDNMLSSKCARDVVF